MKSNFTMTGLGDEGNKMGMFVIFACLAGLVLLYAFFDLIVSIIKGLVELIWVFIILIYKHFAVDKPMEKSGFLKRKQMEEEMLAAAKEEKHREQILNDQNKIIQAGLNNVRELRVRFPNADEELFQNFLRKFPSYSVDELKLLGEGIRESHLKNQGLYNNGTLQTNVYTEADLNGLNPLDEYREDPLIVWLYKIQSDYLLIIKNNETGERKLFQSRDYLIIAGAIHRVLEFQRGIRKQKLSVSAKQLDAIFDIASSAGRRG